MGINNDREKITAELRHRMWAEEVFRAHQGPPFLSSQFPSTFKTLTRRQQWTRRTLEICSRIRNSWLVFIGRAAISDDDY